MPAPAASQAEVRAAIDRVWRAESAALVGAVARLVRDIAQAEELVQEALLEALEHWPADGLPRNPAAWLMTTARNRALDRLRRGQRSGELEQALAEDMAARGDDHEPDFAPALAERLDDDIGDDVLRLMFTACHPLLAPESRVALTLKVVAGLSTAEIARAFLVPEPTLAQRLVRAKRQLSEARVPFEVPQGHERGHRLASVLEAVYLLFTEGHAASSGGDWTRPALVDEALRLARRLAALAPHESEVLGLLALLELQASRLPARRGTDGRPVLLEQQDRSRWDRLLIRRGLAGLAQAQAAAAQRGEAPGPYTLQAELAAVHARAATAADTDWAALVAAYDRLLARQPSPVVRLNRAVALWRAQGATAAWAEVQALQAEPALAAYPYLPAVAGELLLAMGRSAEAQAAFELAAARAGNDDERMLMAERAAAAQVAQAGQTGQGGSI